MQEILSTCYKQCEDILSAHRDTLQRVSDYLLEHETMDGDTFEAMMQEPKDTAPALPVQVPDTPADPE